MCVCALEGNDTWATRHMHMHAQKKCLMHRQMRHKRAMDECQSDKTVVTHVNTHTHTAIQILLAGHLHLRTSRDFHTLWLFRCPPLHPLCCPRCQVHFGGELLRGAQAGLHVPPRDYLSEEEDPRFPPFHSPLACAVCSLSRTWGPGEGLIAVYVIFTGAPLRLCWAPSYVQFKSAYFT